MAEFLTGFSNILWGAPVLILLGIVGLLYGIRTKFFQIRKMGYILKNTAGEMFKKGGGASGNKGTALDHSFLTRKKEPPHGTGAFARSRVSARA